MTPAMSRITTLRLALGMALALIVITASAPGVVANSACPPASSNSVRFAIIGDTGTGGSGQLAVSRRMIETHRTFPFSFVLMLGDNLYGGERPQDYAKKFEVPYQALLDAKVAFHAALGNHDDPNQRYYKPFNMNGERYYSFRKGPARFIALDSNYMDGKQRQWVARELDAATEPWKFVYFHHPIYSSGAKHGAEEDLRLHLEPIFLKAGVAAVFAGHEHFYERLKPQKGIHYFIAGAAAKLRKGDITKSDLTAKGLDTDYSFILVELTESELAFQAITAAGKRFDSGVLRRDGRQHPFNSFGAERCGPA